MPLADGVWESTVVSQCAMCRHRAGSVATPICAAFPGGIPDSVLRNAFDHRRPYVDVEGLPADAGISGDTPILFEPRQDADPDALERLSAALDRASGYAPPPTTSALGAYVKALL